MKKRIVELLLVISVMTAMICGCKDNGQITSNVNPVNVEAKEQKKEVSFDLSESESDYSVVSDFGYKLFKENIAGQTNPVMSPVSAYIALAMAGNGAAGQTKEEFEEVMGSQTKMTYLSHYMMNRFPYEMEDRKMTLANSAWLDKRFVPTTEWIDTLSLYKAEIFNEALPTEQTMNAMNSWINKNTEGLIQKMLEQPLDDKARLVLFNALHFNGKWAKPFEANDTYKRPFYVLNDAVVDVEMMHQTGSFDYICDKDFEGVILPYKDDKYSMVAVKAIDGTNIREKMEMITPEKISDMMDKKNDIRINLALPKFTVEFDRNLNESLQSMGIKMAFDDVLADFSGIGKNDNGNNIYISLVRQKAKVIVDEEGTEAAAVTEVAMFECTSAVIDMPKTVEFDRPFVYMIMDNETQIPVFMGIMDNPISK